MVQDNYRIGDAAFGVRSTSLEFADAVRLALADAQTDEEADPALSVELADAQRGPIRRLHVLYRRSARCLATASPRRLFVGVLREARAGAMPQGSEHAYVWASVVIASDGSAIVLPPLSTPERDRLAPRLRRLGARLVDGDVAAISIADGLLVPTRDAAPDARLADALSSSFPEPTRDEYVLIEVPGPRRLAAVLVKGQDGRRMAVSAAASVTDLAGRTINLATLGARALRALGSAVGRIGDTTGACQDCVRVLTDERAFVRAHA